MDSGLGALSDGEREVVGLSPIAGGELSEGWGDRVGMSISSRAGGGVTLGRFSHKASHFSHQMRDLDAHPSDV